MTIASFVCVPILALGLSYLPSSSAVDAVDIGTTMQMQGPSDQTPGPKRALRRPPPRTSGRTPPSPRPSPAIFVPGTGGPVMPPTPPQPISQYIP